MIIDCFAGGGGASVGIEMALVAVYSKKQRNVWNLKERRTNGTVKYF